MKADRIAKIPVPAESRLAPSLASADFADCYALPDPQPQQELLALWLQLAARSPRWMNLLMSLRNRAVRLVGLKHLGQLQADAAKPAEAYRVGDRVGIFTLEGLHPDELLLGDNDRHLHVRLSLRRLPAQEGPPRLALSTVVHEHNRLGWLYMAVVGPVHSLIVPLMLRQISRRQRPKA
ncbi:DUF2867 domain-containing protein [Pelomonas sp. BJYL3]|uniref:DUF2867 domain-containing protein n=1 Tax=Pelomonas sp. BJYL3 TaxID=2976697 RepID=UPI0022B3D0E7|nr:DUF2867 domain-containing protein [Pelomonas sp. BJYL3]